MFVRVNRAFSVPKPCNHRGSRDDRDGAPAIAGC